MEGRQRALEMSRTLIAELVNGGSRALIVSNGEELRTIADLTADHGKLLTALDALDHDPRQWGDTFTFEEDLRVREVLCKPRAF